MHFFIGANTAYRDNFIEIEAELINFPRDNFEYSTTFHETRRSLSSSHKLQCSLGERVRFFYKTHFFLEVWCSRKIFLAEVKLEQLNEALAKIDQNYSSLKEVVEKTKGLKLFPEIFEVSSQKARFKLRSGSPDVCWDKLSSNLSVEKFNNSAIFRLSQFIEHKKDIKDDLSCASVGEKCRKLSFKKLITDKNNQHTSSDIKLIDVNKELPFLCAIRMSNEIKGHRQVEDSNPCYRREDYIYPNKDYKLLKGVVYDLSFNLKKDHYHIELSEKYYDIVPIALSFVASIPKNTINLKNKSFNCRYEAIVKAK